MRLCEGIIMRGFPNLAAVPLKLGLSAERVALAQDELRSSKSHALWESFERQKR
jgi:hypothetical protein